MKVVLTGAAGFRGWHTRLRLRALTDHEVVPVTRQSWAPVSGPTTDAVIHVAGANRGDDAEVDEGNRALAEDVAAAVVHDGAEPDVTDRQVGLFPFRVDLFSTHPAALFPGHYPNAPTPHSDARGPFVETIRVRGVKSRPYCRRPSQGSPATSTSASTRSSASP